jgi:hypothetical protein
VAPSSPASARRGANGSTATICAAPATRAAWTIQSPRCPQPTTATDDPGSTAAALKTAPRPVVMPQPISESSSSESVESTGKIQLRGTRIFSA